MFKNKKLRLVLALTIFIPYWIIIGIKFLIPFGVIAMICAIPRMIWFSFQYGRGKVSLYYYKNKMWQSLSWLGSFFVAVYLQAHQFVVDASLKPLSLSEK